MPHVSNRIAAGVFLLMALTCGASSLIDIVHDNYSNLIWLAFVPMLLFASLQYARG